MQSFSKLAQLFEQRFSQDHFPSGPANLYNAARHILTIGGKRIRPVCVLLANELFGDLHEDAFHAATAVELFHNFSLIHDDILDNAPLRRGMETVHVKYGSSAALLAGDVMLVAAYQQLSKTSEDVLPRLQHLFNNTSRKVCEGQQMDMDFENSAEVNLETYVEMITGKTSVLLACSLQMGAIVGGAGLGNQEHLYEFGKNLGIAFQIQDDYLDAYGDPEKFGKLIGGDILANKKTFLWIHAYTSSSDANKALLDELLEVNTPDKIERVLKIYDECGVEAWANSLKEKYYQEAMMHLEAVAVLKNRKNQLEELALYLMQRQN
ncbi:MAG: polyprenyl synthetase family protein [Chitinophagaceae bacterium]|nr:MAG: polyprenyl synthetase family protein [Chitinophagaceae bacterium]